MFEPSRHLARTMSDRITAGINICAPAVRNLPTQTANWELRRRKTRFPFAIKPMMSYDIDEPFLGGKARVGYFIQSQFDDVPVLNILLNFQHFDSMCTKMWKVSTYMF